MLSFALSIWLLTIALELQSSYSIFEALRSVPHATRRESTNLVVLANGSYRLEAISKVRRSWVLFVIWVRVTV